MGRVKKNRLLGLCQKMLSRSLFLLGGKKEDVSLIRMGKKPGPCRRINKTERASTENAEGAELGNSIGWVE